MLSDRAKTLYDNPRTPQVEVTKLPGYIQADTQAEPGGADLIERNPSDFWRQAHGAVDLILDPRHAAFVGAHVRTRDIFSDVLDGAGKRADQLFLLRHRHFGIADDHRFSTAMRQSCCRIFQSHRPRQPKGFFGADIGGHADPADGWPTSDIVHSEHCL